MRNFQTMILVAAVVVAAGACAGSNAGKVEKVYKPGADNVHTVKGQTEQANYKKAREHCKGDFQVLKKGRVDEGDATLESLEFRCI